MSSRRSPQRGTNRWTEVMKIVNSLYPDLLGRTYAVPPAHFNKVPYVLRNVPGTGLIAPVLDRASVIKPPTHDASSPSQPNLPPFPRSAWTQGVQTPGRVQENDFRDDFAQNHVMYNLQALGDEHEEVMVILSKLHFGKYLNQPAYAAAVTQLPHPSQLDTNSLKHTDGEPDFVIIHREHGILVGELKSIGKWQASSNVHPTNDAIAKRVRQALKQLDRSATVMRHLVSDVAPGLAVRKTLFLPYISSGQLKQVLIEDPNLEQETCTSLGAVNAEEAVQLSCCSDQLSEPSTYWNITATALGKLHAWWTDRMTCTVATHLSDEIYIDIVARFVGPATTVDVHSNFSPRVEVRTRGQAVAEMGWRLAQLILTLEQLDLMNRDPRLVCITGPPGTGKTIVMILQGLRWLLEERDVHVVSTRPTSRAVSTLIRRQIQITAQRTTTVNPLQKGKVILHHFDLMNCAEDVTKAVGELSQAASRDGSLYLILDEAVFDSSTKQGPLHKRLVTELVKAVPKVHLWAACVLFDGIPDELQQEVFTKPLRCAPVVLREVQPAISRFNVHRYSDRALPSPGDGLSVIRLKHQGKGHVGQWPVECPQCGCDVAAQLRSLGVGIQGSFLRYYDVFILTRSSELQDSVTYQGHVTSPASGVVFGLRAAGMPVHVIGRQARGQNKAKWEAEMANVALAKEDKIFVGHGGAVTGLERRIVVILQGQYHGGDDGSSDLDIDSSDRLLSYSRCSTQLIVVTSPPPVPLCSEPTRPPAADKATQTDWSENNTAEDQCSESSNKAKDQRSDGAKDQSSNQAKGHSSNQAMGQSTDQAIGQSSDKAESHTLSSYPESPNNSATSVDSATRGVDQKTTKKKKETTGGGCLTMEPFGASTSETAEASPKEKEHEKAKSKGPKSPEPIWYI